MDTTTALTLIIPSEHHEKINQLRAVYDKAFPRWQPHINFFFPFVPIERFPEIEEKLKQKLSGFGKFKLDLNEIGYFQQKGVVTVHVKSNDSSKLKELFDLISEVLPDVNSKHAHFEPHMTIAQFRNEEFNSKTNYLKDWLGTGFSFTVDRIHLISRSKTDQKVPFSVIQEIVFK